MTSRRVAAANRRNARLSTGPRTATGKRSAALNALRHGLSAVAFTDPVPGTEVAELAERIANGSTDPGVRARACDVAEAQVDVERVRYARYAVIARPVIAASGTRPRSGRLRAQLRELVALDRYERRAISRRRSAIRAFQAALFHSIGRAR